jgi:hypothetical protein
MQKKFSEQLRHPPSDFDWLIDQQNAPSEKD